MNRQKIWMFLLVSLVTLGTVWASASIQSEDAPEEISAPAQEDVETKTPFAPPEPLLLHHAQDEEACEERPELQPCDCFHEDDLVPCRCVEELSFCPDACFEGFTIKPCEETHGECFCAH